MFQQLLDGVSGGDKGRVASWILHCVDVGRDVEDVHDGALLVWVRRLATTEAVERGLVEVIPSREAALSLCATIVRWRRQRGPLRPSAPEQTEALQVFVNSLAHDGNFGRKSAPMLLEHDIARLVVAVPRPPMVAAAYRCAVLLCRHLGLEDFEIVGTSRDDLTGEVLTLRRSDGSVSVAVSREELARRYRGVSAGDRSVGLLGFGDSDVIDDLDLLLSPLVSVEDLLAVVDVDAVFSVLGDRQKVIDRGDQESRPGVRPPIGVAVALDREALWQVLARSDRRYVQQLRRRVAVLLAWQLSLSSRQIVALCVEHLLELSQTRFRVDLTLLPNRSVRDPDEVSMGLAVSVDVCLITHLRAWLRAREGDLSSGPILPGVKAEALTQNVMLHGQRVGLVTPVWLDTVRSAVITQLAWQGCTVSQIQHRLGIKCADHVIRRSATGVSARIQSPPRCPQPDRTAAGGA